MTRWLLLLLTLCCIAQAQDPFMPVENELPPGYEYCSVPKMVQELMGISENPGYLSQKGIANFGFGEGDIVKVLVVNVSPDNRGFVGYFAFTFKDEETLEKFVVAKGVNAVEGRTTFLRAGTNMVLFGASDSRHITVVKGWIERLKERLSKQNIELSEVKTTTQKPTEKNGR